MSPIIIASDPFYWTGTADTPVTKPFLCLAGEQIFNYNSKMNTPGRMVQADRAGGACVPLKWCTAAAAMVH